MPLEQFINKQNSQRIFIILKFINQTTFPFIADCYDHFKGNSKIMMVMIKYGLVIEIGDWMPI
jgi:hypothetical protein